ncbi:hypothetical protein QMK33_06800 [Hymenobacter sp. H14-R3]|uniref:hypothetical protein n=1 Tax=Hymenobacter sp. H14-R3 TaxID=3046308 RepID=UPI0024BB0FA3|nr:hypothetical protein [Hymenobacter sp. H14-R3]MDJ0364856.1 hypothetical protein [Hymenobacter sp. H14-R3]
MLTSVQFSQLAAAAWSGPAAAIIASIEHYAAAAGDHASTTYSASYHVGGVCHMGRAECPLAAVAAAVQHYTAGIEAEAARQLASAQVARRFARRVLATLGGQLAGRPLRGAGFACRARRHRCLRLLRA